MKPDSDEPTVTPGGREISAYDLREAVENLPDTGPYGPGDVGKSADVCVFGDHSSDHWVFVSPVEDEVISRDQTSIDSFHPDDLVSWAEEVIDEHESQTFESYLKENVFTLGEYTYEEQEADDMADIRVAEHSDGYGLIIGSCVEAAVEDENVGVEGIQDGWLLLDDDRDE